jgi:hypothetical protein
MLSYAEVLIGVNTHEYIHLVENELEQHAAKWQAIDFHDNEIICERLQQQARFNIARGLLKIRIAAAISNASTGTSHIQPAAMMLSVFDFNPCIISSEIPDQVEVPSQTEKKSFDSLNSYNIVNPFVLLWIIAWLRDCRNSAQG